MKNFLIWAGLAALAFSDFFKSKPVRTVRTQQFLQTGETSQAFVGSVKDGSYSWMKSRLINMFGKGVSEGRGINKWNVSDRVAVLLEKSGSMSWYITVMRDGGMSEENVLATPELTVEIRMVKVPTLDITLYKKDGSRYKKEHFSDYIEDEKMISQRAVMMEAYYFWHYEEIAMSGLISLVLFQLAWTNKGNRDDLLKIASVAMSGDGELALQIAKGQGFI